MPDWLKYMYYDMLCIEHKIINGKLMFEAMPGKWFESYYSIWTNNESRY